MSTEVAGEALLLVTNGRAGSLDDEVVEATRVALGTWAEVEVVSPATVEDCAACLGDLGGRRLLVAGGDGSIHVVVNELHRAGVLGDVPVGILPLGTGNDLARTLGIPLEPAEAVEVLRHGVERRLDAVASDLGVLAVNASHAGLGAAAAERSEDWKPRFGPLAYPIGALAAGIRESGWALRVTVDGHVVHDGPALMVGLGNGRTIGGGTALTPEAEPDDGLVDVVVATGTGPAARTAFAAALVRGTHLERDDVLLARGRVVEVSGDEVVHDVDGELLGPVPSARYEVLPHAWRAIVPRP